jgi:hypothetical protein
VASPFISALTLHVVSLQAELAAVQQAAAAAAADADEAQQVLVAAC